MFYLNQNDMDEVFRNAADNYPLKTEGVADWNKLSGLLQNNAGNAFADAGNFKKEKLICNITIEKDFLMRSSKNKLRHSPIPLLP